MVQVDTRGWTAVGSSSGHHFYALEPDILIGVPRPGLKDTAAIARETIAWHDAWWRRQGHTGCLVYFVDAAADQDPEARRVYREETEDALTHATALIAQTFWGRVASKTFLTLVRHRIPMRVFGSLDEARPWLDEMNRRHKRPL